MNLNFPSPPAGGPYHPATVYTFGESGQQATPMHHPGVSLRNEVAIRIYRDLVYRAACSEEESEDDPRDITEDADAIALGAFIFADAFLKASHKKL